MENAHQILEEMGKKNPKIEGITASIARKIRHDVVMSTQQGWELKELVEALSAEIDRTVNPGESFAMKVLPVVGWINDLAGQFQGLDIDEE